MCLRERRLGDRRDTLLLEAHQFDAGMVDSHRVEPGHQHADRLVDRDDRTVLLAGDQAVAVPATATRFVRLTALAAQDAAAGAIDLRELQVYGGGPNVPPSGTVAPLATKNTIKSIVRLRAAFTDPDSTILRYLWDFDGDGRFDQATRGPQVAHVWSAAGTYAVTVGARDFRGALGTTTLALRITDPTVPVEPISPPVIPVASSTPEDR